MSFEKAVIEVELAKLQFERNRKYIPYKDTGTGCCTQGYRWTIRNSGELGKMKRNRKFERNQKYIPYKDTGIGSCTRDYRWVLYHTGFGANSF